MILNRLSKASKEKKNKKFFPNSVIDVTVKYDDSTKLEGMNKVGFNTNIMRSTVGLCTNIGQNSYLPNCLIGRYSSISSDVIVIEYTHPIDFVSTYPGFFNTINELSFGRGDIKFNEELKNSDGSYVKIGNDVWIGRKVLLKGGITIGDGAIIGMGSVVTKDVPPYAIVAGNPARIIRFRFDETEIKELCKIQWWFWDIQELKSISNLFANVKGLISYAKNKGK